MGLAPTWSACQLQSSSKPNSTTTRQNNPTTRSHRSGCRKLVPAKMLPRTKPLPSKRTLEQLCRCLREEKKLSVRNTFRLRNRCQWCQEGHLMVSGRELSRIILKWVWPLEEAPTSKTRCRDFRAWVELFEYNTTHRKLVKVRQGEESAGACIPSSCHQATLWFHGGSPRSVQPHAITSTAARLKPHSMDNVR